MNKKELKESYRQYKPDMGVYAYICKTSQTTYLGYGKNIKADINSISFQLKIGCFRSNTKCNLQDDWNKYGEFDFDILLVEKLEYDTDESKTDYTEDLRVLRELCSEKFMKIEFIQK